MALRANVSPRVAAGALCLAASACLAAAPPPLLPPGSEPLPVAKAPTRDRWTGFALRGPASPTTRVELADGGALELIDGRRIHLSSTGQVLGATDAPVGARGALRVPDALGGGIAFHGSGGVAVAPTPLGLARSLVTDPVRDLSFGPRGALVLLDDGRRTLVDVTRGGASPVTPPSASAFGLGDDGIAAAWLEGGHVVLSRDRGATWQPLATPTTIAELFTARGAVAAVDVDGALLRLERGALVAVAPPPPKRSEDPRWVLSESPVELVVREGALLDGDRGIVAVRGSVHVVDLQRGALAFVEPGVLPANRPCETLALSREVLFACPDDGRLAIFTRPRDRAGVRLERTFAGAGRLVRGGGDALLYTGTCEGDATQVGRACLRGQEGWTSIDRAALFEGEKPAQLLAWVPTEKSALAILGGSSPGILDAATGERTVIEGAAAQRLASIASPRSEAVEQRFHVVDGAILGWSRDETWVRIADGGKTIEVAPFRMNGARVAGPRALALGPDETLWQTSDWGRTYREIATPPVRLGQPAACSDAGCTFGRWVRWGWDESPPAARLPPGPTVPATLARRPSLPELRCGTSGPQARRAVAEGAQRPPGLGAELLRADDTATVFRPGPDDPMSRLASRVGLTAVETGPQRAVTADGRLAAVGATRQVRFLSPFDPGGVVKSARFGVSELIDAAHAVALGPLDGDVLAGEGAALPVLTPASEETELLLLREVGIATWLRAGGAPVAMATTREGVDVGTPTSAARAGAGLAVLFTAGDGSGAVHTLGPGRAELLFTAPTLRRPDASPRTMDALAIDEDGAVALIRVPTAGPPDRADPAWLLRRDGAVRPLAAWSTLAADGAAGCDATRGARAIITTDVPWIQLGATRRDTARATMRVRWSADRVCLEAIEVFFAEHSTPVGSAPSRVVASFGERARAGLVLVDAGVELREPRTCELSPAR